MKACAFVKAVADLLNEVSAYLACLAFSLVSTPDNILCLLQCLTLILAFVNFLPQYIEKMQLKYNGEAQKSGVYVISACGYDSIPAEAGILFAKNKFGGFIFLFVNFMSIRSQNLKVYLQKESNFY